jgi:hypothetical protein
MRHRKFFNLLASLSREEFRRFGKFLNSPYFNESEDVQTFFEFLKLHYPVFDPQKMRLEAAFKRLFPDKLKRKKSLEPETKNPQQILEKKLNYFVSDVYRLLETFLAVEEALLSAPENNNTASLSGCPLIPARQSGLPYKDELLFKGLGRHSDYALFERQAHYLLDKIAALPVLNSDDYWLTAQIHHWHYYHPATDKLKQKEPGILSAMQQLDLYYLLTKLRYAAELAAWGHIRPADFHILFFREIMEEAERLVNDPNTNVNTRNNYPLISVYLELVKLYRNNEEETRFLRAKSLFFQYASSFPAMEQLHVLTHLLNVGIRLYIVQSMPLEKELLFIYRWGMDNGLLFINNRMTVNTFLNIGCLAAECNEQGWAESFILKYKSYVEEKAADDACKAVMSNIFLARKEYDKAQDYLKDLKGNKPPYNILVRTLLLKIFFEKLLKNRGESLALFNHAETLEQYISSQNLDLARTAAFLRFVRITRKLAHHWLDDGQLLAPKKRKLLAEVDAEKYIFSKKWLLSKINEL